MQLRRVSTNGINTFPASENRSDWAHTYNRTRSYIIERTLPKFKFQLHLSSDPELRPPKSSNTATSNSTRTASSSHTRDWYAFTRSVENTPPLRVTVAERTPMRHRRERVRVFLTFEQHEQVGLFGLESLSPVFSLTSFLVGFIEKAYSLWSREVRTLGHTKQEKWKYSEYTSILGKAA